MVGKIRANIEQDGADDKDETMEAKKMRERRGEEEKMGLRL